MLLGCAFEFVLSAVVFVVAGFRVRGAPLRPAQHTCVGEAREASTRGPARPATNHRQAQTRYFKKDILLHRVGCRSVGDTVTTETTRYALRPGSLCPPKHPSHKYRHARGRHLPPYIPRREARQQITRRPPLSPSRVCAAFRLPPPIPPRHTTPVASRVGGASAAQVHLGGGRRGALGEVVGPVGLLLEVHAHALEDLWCEAVKEGGRSGGWLRR